MAESLADDFYAALANVKKAQQDSRSSKENVQIKSLSAQSVSSENLVGKYSNELQSRKKSRPPRRNTSLDHFRNNSETMAESLADDFYAALANVKQAQQDSRSSKENVLIKSLSTQSVSPENLVGKYSNELQSRKKSRPPRKDTSLDHFGNNSETMAESLADNFYATLANVKQAQQDSRSSKENVQIKSLSAQSVSSENLVGKYSNELQSRKKSRPLRRDTSLDHFGNNSEIKDNGKYEALSKKEKNISKPRECILPPTEDQTLGAILKYELFPGKGGNKKHVGERSHSYCSADDVGWKRVVPKTKNSKSRNQKPNSGCLKGEIVSNTFHKAGKSFKTEAGHDRLNTVVPKTKNSKSRNQKPNSGCLKGEIVSNTFHKAGKSFKTEAGHDRLNTGEDQSGGHYAAPTQEQYQGLSQQGVERKCVLGYRQLEKLADEEPYEILMVLANQRCEFETLLNRPLKPDMLILIVRVLSKLCKADFEENKVALLSLACIHEFLDQLSQHIALIPLEVDKKRKENVGSFFEDLMTFLETVVSLLPSKAVQGCGKIFMITDMLMRNFEGQQLSCFNFDEVKTKFVHVKARYEVCIEEKEEEKKEKEKVNICALEIQQDDFRKISIYPNAEEILAEEPGFVRPNIIEGAYESVDHYLDTQFRLLREDFVSPLREGISGYINMTNKRMTKKLKSVRIYHKVEFLTRKVIKDQFGLVVCFDPNKHLKKVNWEHSKRLLFGSLLLFSRNDFANIIFGTVMYRDLEDLKKGKIVVRLGEGSDVCDYIDLFSNEFVMAESQVYFEPYYHVLKALQTMKQKSFPMEKYIIHAEMSADAPKYMCSEGGVLLDIDGRAVCVLQDDSWPGPLELELDVSQYRAFKSALTKEFVIIQGPPGTGKTFLGLKVASVLLKNFPIWNASRNPILLVCYTNHALDQFLEGLIAVTNKIVRVGGQSKSKILEGYNLREKRKSHKRKINLCDLMRNIYYKISRIRKAIQSILTDVEMIANHRGIISLSVLNEVHIIHDQHLGCFASHNYMLTEELFTEWLEYGRCDDVPPYGAEGYSNENWSQNVDINDDAADYDDGEGDGGGGGDGDGDIEAEAICDDEEDLQCNMLDDLESQPDIRSSCLTFALDLKRLEEDIEWYELQKQYLQTQIREDPSLLDWMHMQEDMCEDLKLRLNYIKRQLCRKGNENRSTVERLLQVRDLWQLQAEERWILYRYWANRYRNALLEELCKQEEKLRCETRMYEEVQQINDLDILKDSLIVGMTTSGAAKLHSLLQALKARIVIVEEAAEVNESHIVASLTRHCEHLILIGDHKQLRPSPAVYRLAHDFNFDISLFERMLKNKMHCEVLKVQHRMRPEIAELIVPAIYPELLNHSSVLQYERIHGVLKSVFFVTHNRAEEEVEDISSHRNTHEGDFLIALCRYLVMQGYSPSHITILATYSGQMFYLRSVQKKYSMLDKVKIMVVDNFQGEENDIILLSLVRSNSEAKIGFLKIENRVCVALSRAKMGFYIIGNMDNLTRSSKIWPKIKETLKKQQALGTDLTLRCQVHPSVFTRVCTAADFHKVPEGGCLQICGAELPCGHRCKRVCHVRDRDHGNILCSEPCERIPENCELQHKCRKLCFDDCGDCRTLVPRTLHCGHTVDLHCCVDAEKYKCPVVVEFELIDCGHKAKKPCHMDTDLIFCSYPCEDRLPCGHSCRLSCHKKDDPDHLQYECYKPCTRKNANCKEDHVCSKQCYEECGDCKVQVEKELPFCGHTARMSCYTDPETYCCMRKCHKILPCEHPCPNVCSASCGNCQVQVIKQLVSCGHPLQVKCCEQPDQKLCKSPCERTLPCGHKCTTVCSDVCTKKCLELIPSAVRPLCGHLVYIPCHMQEELLTPDSQELLSRCQMPCGVLLNCNHRCVGTCGECMQGRIHEACKEKCGRTLVCGHSCNIPCAESCPPCNRKCTYSCKHSKCSRICGRPCIQCKEPCDWACVHHRCSKLCFELCDREPCNEPCEKLLPCRHPCIGFCGERCPPLCRICNKDEVTEVFFGTEDEPDARFIYLEDCRHVLEASGLDQWMAQTLEEIKLKDCPLCKTPITKTQRFMNIVKKVYNDVQHVKTRVYGNARKIEASRDDLKKKLMLLTLHHSRCERGSTQYRILYDKLWAELQPVRLNRRNPLSATRTDTLAVQLEMFCQLVECCSNAYSDLREESRYEVISYMDTLLHAVKKRGSKISGQEIEEINMEIQRFHRLCQLYMIISDPTYKMNCSKPEVKKCFDTAHRIAYSIEKFSKECDMALKDALENLRKELKSAVIIGDAERKMIVGALGFKQGHWYKCRNGHIYSIGECGGAMQIGRCNECGEAIGGSNHRLLSDNSLASEMDGATRPAWPQ